MELSIQKLGMAYRKAKVDLYYNSLPPLLRIAEYEANLPDHLESLRARLNGDDESWVTDEAFLGGWTLTTKSISPAKDKLDRDSLSPGGDPIHSSPYDAWAATHRSGGIERPKAILRLMADVSLDFHVLGALWIAEVGSLFDEKLKDNAYGNRLRRGSSRKINPLSLGSFQPYLKPFRDWRDGGIRAMQSALAANKSIVALTADVSSFYHELRPGFMRDPRFLSLFDFQLTADQLKLHRLFITALEAWASHTKLTHGLPVGLPASAVVANVALIELDRIFERQVVPLYYGRYVDDILLVMENGANLRNATELWAWLFTCADKLLSETKDKKGTCFCPAYLGDSKIRFENGKNKMFLLRGPSGITLVDSIAQQIHKRASEHRSLPTLPHDAKHVATALAAATQTDGDTADNLRKTSSMSMKRAGFALRLRDFEAYERDLPPDQWQAHRHAFLKAVIEHVLVPDTFFDLSQYLPRIIRLATACEDFKFLQLLIDALLKIVSEVSSHCEIDIKALPTDSKPDPAGWLRRWQGQLLLTVYESIVAAYPPKLSKTGKKDWKAFEDHANEHWWLLPMPSLAQKECQSKQALLFSCDLAHMPFRFSGLPAELVTRRGIPAKKAMVHFKPMVSLVKQEVADGCQLLSQWLGFKSQLPQALLFATRPYSLAELFILAGDKAFEGDRREALIKIVLALRGFSPAGQMPRRLGSGVLQLPRKADQDRIAIAVTSWKTDIRSWTAAASGLPDPDIGRYERLTRLINEVISRPAGAHYLVMPELSIPVHWFMRLSRNLLRRRISLIAGVEYLRASRGKVRNQVWASLLHDGLGFPSLLVYRQDKQRPALHEEQELQRLAGLEMRPEVEWKPPRPPIIEHGDFRFAMLVCSELTNISYRAALCGEVDAVFVPEWNQDIDTFNALVESAALDIHAYIIQCNDRSYGDSRIRSPHKDSWKRDILRVRGGLHDYCISAEIDVQALRQFQSSHRSAAEPFKPVPDGFSMSPHRRVLPKSQ